MKRVLFGILLMVTSCTYHRTADEKQNALQEKITMQAVSSVGMPNITNFQEKRTLKEIYELRDRQITTITYLFDMKGHLHKLCDSVGYGIPYATQYTSPSYIKYHSGGSTDVLPQADPNGLYSPSNAEGTWILCLDSSTKRTKPVYVEPRIIVSPIALSE